MVDKVSAARYANRERRDRARSADSSDSDSEARRITSSSMKPRNDRVARRESDRYGGDSYRGQARDRDDRDTRRRKDIDSSRRDRESRDRSPSRNRSRERRRSRSPPAKRRRRSDSRSRSPRPGQRSRNPLPSQNESFHGNRDVATPDGPPIEKQKPNYKPTGLLAKEANTVVGTTTVLKYHEPPEARKPSPKHQWRMYVFKKKDLLDTIYIHERSVWLFGRDQNITDLFLEHPSISKQHAVIQFRHIASTNEYGDKQSKVKPYLIDLESANGTKLNGKKVEASRYVELVDGDVVAFGDSEREYVLMLPPAAK